ncbi:FecR family protein [Parapedobacter soli]|uniref:FecR family protein n=1 Tax=Parapedobacter soli TaxID=416955 RepID=UPI0021C60C3F|nr:FecR family protein [Parapedobacter soli]
MEQLDDILLLLRKHVAGNLTEAERKLLNGWSKQHPANKALLECISDEESFFTGYLDYRTMYDEEVSGRLQRIEDTIMESIKPVHVNRDSRKRGMFRWMSYAAAVLLVTSASIWFVNQGQTDSQQIETVIIQDIQPGGNRATLTLTDGRMIDLDEGRDGVVIGSDEITYSDRTPLVVVDRKEGPMWLELTTPKGGTYQVTLSDGTRVWLNAASTLKYPSVFEGKERVVEITGEAYFSVAKRANQPFKLIAEGQELTVLGTEFNISAYADEEVIKTTLVKGQVQVQNTASGKVSSLVPNQQSVVRPTNTEIMEVDVQPYVAWKDGYFCFRRTAFKDVMRQLARWYDVQIVYKGDIPQDTFSGEMGRELTLNAALELLNVSAVRVQIAMGNQLIVH